MNDYKMEAAKAALQFIKPGQTIGLGAGTTICEKACIETRKKKKNINAPPMSVIASPALRGAWQSPDF